jgi:peptidoglycan-N-acetylglucosamine deacetylase
MKLMNRYRPNWLIRRLTSPWLTWRFSSGGKIIYLSFDDGPDAGVTPQVLDVLDKYGAKATFFLCGRKVMDEPDLVKMILNKGHATGNHTFSHLNGMCTATKTYLQNIEACSHIVSSKLFRPPYGKIRPRQVMQLKKSGYKVIMWTVLSCDFNQHLDPAECLRQSIRYTTDGSIIVFHDSVKAATNMLYVLPKYLAHFSQLGYTFAAIHEKSIPQPVARI